MKLSTLSLTVLTVASVGSCIAADPASRAAIQVPGPVRTVITEPGVVPPGTSLVVRTNDTVRTRRAYRETIYEASLAEDVLDQHGNVLIPKSSPVELGVRWFSFLGPGGAGMRELLLGVRGITVKGVYYPVATQGGEIAGGLRDNIQNPEWLGGGGIETGHVRTIGSRIDVPTGALVAFQTEDPIRLRGYQR